ncbi:MAG: Uma2 family endonuclease [Myxococcota bacterium]
MTSGEYLLWESQQTERHEFHDGEVFATVGGSPRHNALCAAIIRDLGVAVRGTGCRVLTSDQRTASVPGKHFVYADASLVCGPIELAEGTTDVLANPRAVFEVLSRSTEAYDRGDKWATYRRMPSLSDYLLVSVERPRIEWFQRQGQRWSYDVVEDGGRITLGEGFELELDLLYEGIFEISGG